MKQNDSEVDAACDSIIASLDKLGGEQATPRPRQSWLSVKVRQLTRMVHKPRCVTPEAIPHGEDCAGGYLVFPGDRIVKAYKDKLSTYGLIWRGDHMDVLTKAESVVWLRMPLPFGWSIVRWPPETPRCDRTLWHNGGISHCLREKGHAPDAHLFELPDCDTRVGK